MGRKEPVLSLEHDGVVYSMEARDFTALDELELWRVTGTTLLQVFTGGATLFNVAGLVWRWRVNHGEPDLSYLDVARTFTYQSMQTVSDGPREGGPPEA